MHRSNNDQKHKDATNQQKKELPTKLIRPAENSMKGNLVTKEEPVLEITNAIDNTGLKRLETFIYIRNYTTSHLSFTIKYIQY